MKTIYDSNYQRQFTNLFTDAFEILKTAGKINTTDPDSKYFNREHFNSLEEYFTFIGDLAYLHGEQTKGDKNNTDYNVYSKFLMLPMEEVYGNDLFIIDPNSRNIKVPSNFIKNGVSITGDQMAETLLFEIDRFFDTVDLVRTDIYVQWKNPAGKENASKIVLVDYEIKPGKIIFGWPLTDEVTVEGDGKLQFSIRFIKKNGTTINYSLNTNPVTVSIKDALKSKWDYDEKDIDNPSQLFTAAIENGVDSTAPLAEKPEFTINLNDNKQYHDLEDGKIIFVAEAVSGDQGDISYQYSYVPRVIEDNKPVTKTQNQTTWNTIDLKYVETLDTKPTNKKIYYQKGESGSWKRYIPEENENPSQMQLWEKVPNFEVIWEEGKHVTGEYTIKAINTIDNGNYSNAQGDTAIVRCIESIEYSDNLPLDKFLEDGEAYLYSKIETNPIDAIKTYQLEYSKSGAPGTYNKIEALVESPVEELGVTVSEPGWYRVVATGEKNKEIMTATSDICRVVNHPQAPIIKKPIDGYKILSRNDDNHYNPTNESFIMEIVLEKDFVQGLETDEINYTWYRNTVDNNQDEELTNDTEGVLSGIGTNILEIKAKTSEQFYCVVTNTLAGEKASAESHFFIIV